MGSPRLSESVWLMAGQDGVYLDTRHAKVARDHGRVSPHLFSKHQLTCGRIGRGTTYQSGIAIAYATLDHILRHIRCRTLFATHYHEVCDLLQGEGTDAKRGVEYWYTDLDESVGCFLPFHHSRP